MTRYRLRPDGNVHRIRGGEARSASVHRVNPKAGNEGTEHYYIRKGL